EINPKMDLKQNTDNSSSGKKKSKKNSIIGYIVSILCLLLCLYITVEVINANNHNRPPKIFNLSVSYVPTSSMEPTIFAGDYILFKGTKYSDVNTGSYDTPEDNHKYQSGDIIVFYSNEEDKFIIHRAVGKGIDESGNEYIITWGDNNSTADTEGVTSKMVYGEYVTTLGLLSIFSGGINKNVIFFILVVMFIIMIGMQVFQLSLSAKAKKVKEDRKKEEDKFKEELKLQIMKEELERIKEYNAKKALEENNTENENDSSNDEPKTLKTVDNKTNDNIE
ncbi:MAG: signal peptidase I, partial [Acholeplasmatales bacterium]|nr:signal peptidase I [Acholeplasmatales bacterium]